MKKPLLIVGLLAAIVYACNQPNNSPAHLLSIGNLPTQVFSIDITRDTTLHTKNGALIRIPHGTLSAPDNTVQLEIKEAYSMQDILKGGLTTLSNGQPLSSGGMIYINAVGENKVTFNQPISIATPTPFLDSNMQLFKGNVQPDKDSFQQQITSLQLGDLAITANDTKNAAELRKAIKEIKKAEQLKPKNCDCDCFLNNPSVTTVDNTESVIEAGY